MNKTLVVFSIAPTLMCCLALTAHADVSKEATWTLASGGNGHTYRVVAKTSLISWDSANAAAQAAGGYLATITSAAENAFVLSLIDDPAIRLTGFSLQMATGHGLADTSHLDPASQPMGSRG